MIRKKSTLTYVLLTILATCLVWFLIFICQHIRNIKHEADVCADTIFARTSSMSTSASIDSLVNVMNRNTDFCRVTAEEGLPSQDVRSLLKGADGYIWIGTSSGIARFDGTNIYVCPSTKSENVWSMTELDADTLLVGTSLGLKLYSRKRDELQTIDSLSTIVKAICRLHDGNVMIGTEAGLFLWTKNHAEEPGSANINLKRIRVETGMGSSNRITSLLADGKRGCWFTTANGLGYYDSSSRRISMYRMPETMENSNFFNSLSRYGNNIFLGSFNKGVFTFNIPSKSFSKEYGFEHNLIHNIHVFGHYLLVGTNGLGLKIKNLLSGDVHTMKYDARKSGTVCSNTVQEIKVIDGIPWIGTQFGGMCYLPASDKWYDMYSFGSFSSSLYNVRGFFEYADGAKLIATRSGLVYIDERTNTTRYYTEDDGVSGLRSNIITAIKRVGKEVLVGTYGGGMHIFDRKTLTLTDFSNEEMSQYGCIFDMQETEGNGMWVATQEGLYLLSAKRTVLRHFTTENSPLKSPAVYKLCNDAFGRLWVGTYAGLYLVDSKTCNILPCNAVPGTSKVSYLLPDIGQSMWVATNQGLYHIDADLRTIARYNKQTGLPDDNVTALTREDDKYLWVATPSSLIPIDPSGKKPVGSLCIKMPEGATFYNANVVCDSSFIWWSNAKGLLCMKREYNSLSHQVASRPVVSSYSVDGIESPVLSLSESIIVPSSAKELKLSLTNLRYARSYFSTYEYMLEGYDENWHLLEGENTLSYTDLPSGHYVFKVRAPRSKRSSQISIYVQINHKAALAIVCGCLLLMGLTWYSYRKISHLRNRMKMERQVLSEAVSSKKKTMQARKSSSENTEALQDQLLEYMQREKPYLNARLTIGELAAAISTSGTDLSMLLNDKMNINWSNFINAYRVDEVKRRMLDGDLDKFTLTALAEQCGFVSKTTFFRVFKQLTGMTPAEYCKQNGISVSKN